MKPIAVFTRNHKQYMEAAAEISRRDPNATVVFRASRKWATAVRELRVAASIPVYISVVGGEGTVEYAAELCDGELDPQLGQARTQALLAQTLDATKAEGLWGNDHAPVRTLY